MSISLSTDKTLRNAWRDFDSRFHADFSLTVRPFLPSLPLSVSSHNLGTETFEGQLRAMLSAVEDQLYGTRSSGTRKSRRYRRACRVERICYVHSSLLGDHHAHLYLRKPQINRDVDLELLFRKCWYLTTYERAAIRFADDHPIDTRSPYQRDFDLGEHHFFWRPISDANWAGYGAHDDDLDYSGFNEKVSFIRKRSSTANNDDNRQIRCVDE
jgi:hypothetical protein